MPVITNAGDLYCTQAFVYNTFTQAWTTWVKDINHAFVNEVDDKLYIVASVGKLLVVANKLTGKPENVVRLDPKLFNQPEGITITPEGDIYISNEGGTGVATIFKFIRQKK